MKITIKYNIGITFAFVAYLFAACPILVDDETPLLVQTLFPNSVAIQVVVGVISVVCSTVILMYITRSLWNRLFPGLCGWKHINLAESYALSILVALFIVAAM